MEYQEPIEESPATIAAQDRFVLEWGRMSSSWGINRTMAQIHALLLVTGRPHTMDEIIQRLHISRGNASMNLRDLSDWGIVHRFRTPGSRKDIYHAGNDVIEMLARVIRERKRREIDPTVAAIRECLQMIPENEETKSSTILQNRLETLLELFDVADKVYQQIFDSDTALRETLSQVRENNENPLIHQRDKVKNEE